MWSIFAQFFETAKMKQNQSRKHEHHQYIASNPNKGKSKTTTRHLAALDFLLHIQMKNESSIGVRNRPQENVPENIFENLDYQYEDTPNGSNDLSGKKLQGASAPTVRIPPNIRYQMIRSNEQSADIRNWEDKLSKSLLLTSPPKINQSQHYSHQQIQPQSQAHRLFLSRTRGYPSMIFSVIKYDAGEEKARMLRAEDHGLDVFEMPQRDWRGTSFRCFFSQESKERDRHIKDRNEGNEENPNDSTEHNTLFDYDPEELDDPNLLYGSKRHTKRSLHLPIISSTIFFMTKQALKDELNEQFREKHSNLPHSLTLSKIRNLKKVALLACLGPGPGETLGSPMTSTSNGPSMELSSIALAFISFERLCLKGLVTKSNRRLTMAVCLLLAFKFNEPLQVAANAPLYRQRFEGLFSFFDREWDLPKRQVLGAECMVLVHLSFQLHVPCEDIVKVHHRLLKLLGKTNKSYLGEEMCGVFEEDYQQYMTERTRTDSLDRNETFTHHHTQARGRVNTMTSIRNDE